MAMVRLSIVQFAPVFGDKGANREKIKSMLAGLDADIILLPELCTTGYSFLSAEEVAAAAEDVHGESILLLQQIAEDKNAMIVAGFAEKAEDGLYNSAIIVAPGMEPQVYRKTHLFFKEKLSFGSGNKGFGVYDHPAKDCRVGVMICNDWRYPESARTLALAGADLILCPSNLVSNLWRKVMPARAFENKVYLAVANRYGTETRQLQDGTVQELNFSGGSVCYDPFGEPLKQAEATGDAVLIIDIDPLLARDKSFNAYNDLFGDRQPAYYRL